MSAKDQSEKAIAAELAEVVDPVCQMTISLEDSVGSHRYKDKTYYFCAEDCLDRFQKGPGSYVSENGANQGIANGST